MLVSATTNSISAVTRSWRRPLQEKDWLTVTLLLWWVALLTWVLLLRWVALLLGRALLVWFLLLAVLGITFGEQQHAMWTRAWAKTTGVKRQFFFCYFSLGIDAEAVRIHWLCYKIKYNTTARQQSANKGCCSGVRKKRLKLRDACCGETSVREKKRVWSIILKLNWCVLVFSFYMMV